MAPAGTQLSQSHLLNNLSFFHHFEMPPFHMYLGLFLGSIICPTDLAGTFIY